MTTKITGHHPPTPNLPPPSNFEEEGTGGGGRGKKGNQATGSNRNAKKRSDMALVSHGTESQTGACESGVIGGRGAVRGGSQS